MKVSTNLVPMSARPVHTAKVSDMPMPCIAFEKKNMFPIPKTIYPINASQEMPALGSLRLKPLTILPMAAKSTYLMQTVQQTSKIAAITRYIQYIKDNYRGKVNPAFYFCGKITTIITFNSADVKFDLKGKLQVKKWLQSIATAENNSIGELGYVFCSDDYLYDMNVQYLSHDTLTDVITFPYNDMPVEGEIYISIDRVKDNAIDHGVTFENELSRVMAHGLLHLLGYFDETDEQEAEMRCKEDYYLTTLN